MPVDTHFMLCSSFSKRTTHLNARELRSRSVGLLWAAFTLVLAGCVSPEKITESQTTILFRPGLAPTVIKRGLIDLRVGHSALVEVWSRLPANATRIAVTPGMRLQFLVPPGQVWTDFYIQTTASGYAHGPLAFIQERFASTKPLPDKNWFLLTGRINRPNSLPFPIELTDNGPVTVDMQDSGQLVLFANDARDYYWNNFGRIQVVITRLK
jgi:hypothetical protein